MYVSSLTGNCVILNLVKKLKHALSQRSRKPLSKSVENCHSVPSLQSTPCFSTPHFRTYMIITQLVQHIIRRRLPDALVPEPRSYLVKSLFHPPKRSLWLARPRPWTNGASRASEKAHAPDVAIAVFLSARSIDKVLWF